MTELNIAIRNIPEKVATAILADMTSTIDKLVEDHTLSEREHISIEYRFEEVEERIPCKESTPFSRYLSSTTPEGRS